jgi:uncharacterized protein
MREQLRAVNQTKGTMLCERLETTRGSFERGRGLLGRDGLQPGAGMLFESGPFPPFMWMHMFLMRFPIDIVFLDRNGRVLKINHHLKPWRVSSLVLGARKALELEAGAAAQSRTSEGDVIRLEMP